MGKDYIGTELKYMVAITAPGFDMERDDFTITAKCGNKKAVYKKSDMIIDEDRNYYVLIDTSIFKPGDLYAITEVEVPDSDFEDGKRTEVDRIKLTTLENA